jgi:hypothetical protein
LRISRKPGGVIEFLDSLTLGESADLWRHGVAQAAGLNSDIYKLDGGHEQGEADAWRTVVKAFPSQKCAKDGAHSSIWWFEGLKRRSVRAKEWKGERVRKEEPTLRKRREGWGPSKTVGEWDRNGNPGTKRRGTPHFADSVRDDGGLIASGVGGNRTKTQEGTMYCAPTKRNEI